MIVIPSKNFIKRLESLERDYLTIERAEKAIAKLRKANSLREVANVKSMKGATDFYRIRIGAFRIGFRLVDENTIRLLEIDRRSVFYRNFPFNFQ